MNTKVQIKEVYIPTTKSTHSRKFNDLIEEIIETVNNLKITFEKAHKDK